MAVLPRNFNWDAAMRPSDMGPLLRPAVWGGGAAVALIFAAVSAVSSFGSQRTTGDAMSAAAQLQQAAAINAKIAAQAADLENETRRLAAAVRALSGDRDRLLARLTVIERNLEDATGSIKRQAEQPAEPARQASPLPASPVATLPPPRPPVRNQTAPEPEVERSATGPSGGTQVATAPATEVPDQDSPKPKVEYAVDVGGAVNFEGLRVLWNSTKTATPALMDGLHPVFAARESNNRGVDLRLLVGPLATTEAATRLCAALLAARRYCQMTTFEGQQFTLVSPDSERRPTAAAPTPQARTPAPKARPPARSN